MIYSRPEITKVIIAGNLVDCITYQKPEKRPDKDNLRSKGNPDYETKLTNRVSYLWKARKRLEYLVFANPDLDRFATFTFAENVKDYSKAMKEFNLFIKRLRYHYGKTASKELKYIVVAEFQKRGAVHFHALFNDYLDSQFLRNTWRNGHIKINRCTGKERYKAMYLTKYLTKETATDERLWGRRAFVASYNVKQPETYEFDSIAQASEFIENYKNREKKYHQLDFDSAVKVENDFIGDIDIRRFIYQALPRRVFNAM